MHLCTLEGYQQESQLKFINEGLVSTDIRKADSPTNLDKHSKDELTELL